FDYSSFHYTHLYTIIHEFPLQAESTILLSSIYVDSPEDDNCLLLKFSFLDLFPFSGVYPFSKAATASCLEGNDLYFAPFTPRTCFLQSSHVSKIPVFFPDQTT